MLFRKMRSAILLFVTVTVLVSACVQKRPSQAVYKDILYDTVISVEIYEPGYEDLIPEIKKLARHYDTLFSKTDPSSDIVKINTAKGQPVPVSRETLMLIQEGINYSKLSQGCFDITVGTISSLWDFHTENPVLPEDKALREGLDHISYTNIRISENEVTLTDPETRLDVGGIAKGFIADRLAEMLREKGVRHALINLGGNVLTIGEKPDGQDFRIGLKNPKNPYGAPLTSVTVRDKSVVTTGDYQRCFELRGKTYHHVLDIHTGFPCENDLSSVTIIADSSLQADALSTICFLLGYDKAIDYLENMEDVEAVFITKDGRILCS